MEKPTDQDRVFIAGSKPGATVAREAGAISDPTLAGYVGKHSAQILAGIEVELAEKGRLPEAVLVLVRDLRVEYTRVADESRDGGALIAQFCRVLAEAHSEPEPVTSLDADSAPVDQEPDLDSLSSQELATLCGQELERAEAIITQGKGLSQFFIDQLYRLRDVYNEALSREAEGRGEDEEDEDDGDPVLYRRFMAVLGGAPKKEVVGRPFSQRGSLRMGDKSSGGSAYFND